MFSRIIFNDIWFIKVYIINKSIFHFEVLYYEVHLGPWLGEGPRNKSRSLASMGKGLRGRRSLPASSNPPRPPCEKKNRPPGSIKPIFSCMGKGKANPPGSISSTIDDGPKLFFSFFLLAFIAWTNQASTMWGEKKNTRMPGSQTCDLGWGEEGWRRQGGGGS